MATSGYKKVLQSWIKPQFAWAIFPDIFFIEVSRDDPDVVEFISTGAHEVSAFNMPKAAQKVLALMCDGRLTGQLVAAVLDRAKLKSNEGRQKRGTKIIAYCCGIFFNTAKERLYVVVGRSRPTEASSWISPNLKSAADRALSEHQIKVEEFEKELARARQRQNEAYSDPRMAPYRGMAEASLAAKSLHERPFLRPDCLLSLIPHGVLFEVPRQIDPPKLDSSAIEAIAASAVAPSRDGSYSGIVPCDVRLGASGLVTWTPHTGLPSYPEIRCGLQARLPSAFKKPLSHELGRPEFDTIHVSDVSTGLIDGDRDPTEILQEMADLRLDLPDADRRREELDAERSEHGFDAIAWFQPHHAWTEDTWGIYFDARKLDVLAYSLYQDFTSQRVRVPHGIAAFLAFSMTYAHEMFHARVEAALSWLELTALQARYMRYSSGVYDALRETPEWLEEVLANWTAWQWFKSDEVRSLIGRWTSHQPGVERVVESTLDLSPPGYRDWRAGGASSTWRTFATQFVTGKPKTSLRPIGLPVESILTGPLAYDFRPTDVPLRFVRHGVIADLLQRRPTSLNVPSRREIERALKHFGHNLDRSGGKGGHQKWTGPDQRAFILPTGDPVSPVVFKTFLHHLGIDKASYVHDVRPNL